MTPQLSVVIPVYQNASTIVELHARLARTLSAMSRHYEILFVNDASLDGSSSILEQLATVDSTVVVVSLQENVGQHQAILAGLARAGGDDTVIMDADLQDPPEAIPELVARLDGRTGAVFAARRGAHQPLTRRITSRVFKTLLSWLCGTPADVGVFVAIDRAMKSSLLSYRDAGPSVIPMIGCTGLPLASLPIAREPRADGQSSYSWHARVLLSARALAWVVRWKLRHG